MPNLMDFYHDPTKQSKISTTKKNLNCHISTIFLFRENHKYWMFGVSGKQKIQSSVFAKERERSASLKPPPDTSPTSTPQTAINIGLTSKRNTDV
jgi:hypothetical protein